MAGEAQEAAAWVVEMEAAAWVPEMAAAVRVVAERVARLATGVATTVATLATTGQGPQVVQMDSVAPPGALRGLVD